MTRAAGGRREEARGFERARGTRAGFSVWSALPSFSFCSRSRSLSLSPSLSPSPFLVSSSARPCAGSRKYRCIPGENGSHGKTADLPGVIEFSTININDE